MLASQFASTDQEKMDFARLPQRFRRKQALEWEMEAINVSWLFENKARNTL